MLEEAVIKLQEFVRLNAHPGNDALSLDRDCKHVLSNTFQVNNENHIVNVWYTRDKFNLYLSFTVFGETTPFILDVEFIL